MDRLVFIDIMLSENDIGPTEERVRAMAEASEPGKQSKVRSFLSLANFSARFIPDFATIDNPMSKLTHLRLL